MGAPIDAKVLKGCARRGVADTKELSEAIEDVISRYSTVGGVFVLDRIHRLAEKWKWHEPDTQPDKEDTTA